MATQVGEAVIRLTFDGKDVKASLNKVDNTIAASGKQSGINWANAWDTAVGVVLSKALTKVASMISNQLDAAISRVDTLNRFPKMMTNLGISADDAQASISKMSDKLQGLPTTLDSAASAVQRFTSKNGDVAQSTDLFLALNNAILAGGAPAQDQASALEQLSQAYAKGKPDMMEWRTALQAMPAQLNQVAKAMGFGDNAATELGEALREGDVSMDDFMQTIVKLNKEGVEGFLSFEEQAKNSTGGIGTAITVMKSRITQGIAAIIDEIGAENIANTIVGIGNALKDVLKMVAQVFKFVQQNWNWLGPVLVAVAAAITAIQVAQALLNLTLLASPITWIIAGIVAVVAAITYLIATSEDLRKVIGAVAEFIGNVFKVLANIVKSVFDTIVGIVKWYIDYQVGAFKALGDFFVGIWQGFCNAAQGAWDFITGLFSNLASFFGSIFGAAWEAVRNVFSTGGQIFMGIVDGIFNVFRTFVNAIIGGINAVVAVPFNAINGVLSTLRGIDIAGIKPFEWIGLINVPQIPQLAEGGYANGATNAIIGERGKEVVLPLENNTDNWAGLLASTLTKQMEEEGTTGRPIVVNMTNQINNEMDAEDIGRVLMQSIRRAS